MQLKVRIYLVDHEEQSRLLIHEAEIDFSIPGVTFDSIVRIMEVRYCYQCLMNSEGRRVIAVQM